MPSKTTSMTRYAAKKTMEYGPVRTATARVLLTHLFQVPTRPVRNVAERGFYTMTKHTPGPWELAWEDGKHGVVGATTEGKLLFVVGIVGNDEETAHRNDERKANARLCAAAPEMLEALEYINMLASPNPHRTFDVAMSDWRKSRTGHARLSPQLPQTKNNTPNALSAEKSYAAGCGATSMGGLRYEPYT